MRAALQGMFLGALCILAVGVSAAQTTANTPAATPTVNGAQTGVIGAVSFATSWRLSLSSIKGKPYSAEEVSEREQTLADGTHIKQTFAKAKLYRDSEGRTRREHSFALPNGAAAAAPAFVEIVDPVAGYRYMLDEQRRIARRMQWPPAMRTVVPANQPSAVAVPAKPAPATASVSSTSPRQVQRESLGTQIIAGVPAEGVRRTITMAAGSVGNDRPITTTTETWRSKDLDIVVLSKISDPRSGDTTQEVTNIDMAEPDPALFQVPSDYSIVDNN